MIKYRIGSERRNIFGKEIKSNYSPGPAAYDGLEHLHQVKGRNAPQFSMGYRTKIDNSLNNT